MSKRFINLFIALIFFIYAIYPSSLFSSQPFAGDSDRIDKWVDESQVQDVETFKKIRCPNCRMEFFYVPNREGLHSHFVQYESKKKVGEIDRKDNIDLEIQLKDKPDKLKDADKQDELFNLFNLKDNAKEKSPKDIKQAVRKSAHSNIGIDEVEYKIRQQLTCPYDGYKFFPEGDIIEDSKFKPKALFLEPPSSIESSFSSGISIGFQNDLKQFGYELFFVPEKSKKEKEEENGKDASSDLTKSIEHLTALSMLKSDLNGQSQDQSFIISSEGTAVVPVSPDYIVGPGDTLLINIWGSVQESFPVEIDREGKIILPKSGPLYVWGLKLKEAETLITQRLNEFYTNFNVSVSMGKLRNVRVFIMGEVKKPGAYSISSQSNIFQALYKAGGPTKMGSMRKIKVISTDGASKEIDLYGFLLKGLPADNSIIQSGDTIFVPPIGDTVAISGNVKRPGIYETKGEIPLSDLLDFTGGITPTGNLQKLQVERIKDNQRRVIVDIELKTSSGEELSFKEINLRNGDMVLISPIVRLKHDFVTIIGNVETPGDYALKEDTSVKGLVETAKGLMPGTYLYRVEIARVAKDRSREIIPVNLDNIMSGKGEDILLKEWDILLVYSEAETSGPSFVEIDGSVNKPGKYELTPNMKISDLIFRAGGVTSEDFIRGAELFHIIPGESPIVHEIGIKRISGANIEIDKDIILQAGDTLFVKSEAKLTERKMVEIKGEVKFPGRYPIIQGEHLSDLINRAGGYTEDAFLPGAVFNRKSIKDVQEKMRERFIKREQRALLEEQQAILFRAGSDTAATAVAIGQSLKARMEMMDLISRVDIEGRMVVTLLPVEQLKGTKYDISLENGDFLTIPEAPSAVTVTGSVNNPTSVFFEAGKGIDYYIQRTGGLTKHADRSGIYVIRANGEAINKFMMAKFIERGDTIIIPQEVKYWTPAGQLLKDTVSIFSQLAVGVGVIAVLAQ